MNAKNHFIKNSEILKKLINEKEQAREKLIEKKKVVEDIKKEAELYDYCDWGKQRYNFKNFSDLLRKEVDLQVIKNILELINYYHS